MDAPQSTRCARTNVWPRPSWWYGIVLPRTYVIGALGVDTLDHPNKAIGIKLFSEALGTADDDFYAGILGQLDKLTSRNGRPNLADLNFMLSVIKDIEPRNHLKSMLGAHIAVVHAEIMRCAYRLRKAELVAQYDSDVGAFNKLLRTLVTLMEALRRHRTGGEQKVTVQHVSVQGQAIVGNVTQSPRGQPQQTTAAPLALPDAKAVPMPIVSAPEQRARIPAERKRKQ